MEETAGIWHHIPKLETNFTITIFFVPIFPQISGGGASCCTHLVDEELQLDDGGSALVLAVALHAGPSEPESVASQGKKRADSLVYT